MINFLKGVFKFFRSRLYMDESFILYKYEKNTRVKSDVILVDINGSNLEDVLLFESKASLKYMKKMLSDGKKGLLGYMGDRCVHRSWYQDSKGKVLIYKFLPYFLQEHEVFIHDCATSIEMRGKNIYPYTLAHIAQKFEDATNVYVATNIMNEPSKRGILKAGYIPQKKMRIKVILGIKRRSVSNYQ